MKIKINIEKKHLYYLISLFCLLVIGLVIATPSWESPMDYHETLYTNTIESLDGSPINVEGSLHISGNLEFTGDFEVTEGFRGKKPFGIIRIGEAGETISGSCKDQCNGDGYDNCMLAMWFDREIREKEIDGFEIGGESDPTSGELGCDKSFNNLIDDDNDNVMCFCDNYN